MLATLSPFATLTPSQIPVGRGLPALTSHAISVSLPLWADNIAYEEGELVGKMETGYPRFFIHLSIQKLAANCLAKFGQAGEDAMLFPTPRIAAEARDFLAAQNPPIPSRIVERVICPGANSLKSASAGTGIDCIELQVLFFGKEHFPYAKAFWQHTGDGISSRMADRALAFLGELPAGPGAPNPAPAPAASSSNGSASHIAPQPQRGGYSRNRHYARKCVPGAAPAPTEPARTDSPAEDDGADVSTYVEERYGRNLPLFNAPLAKTALKRRIAGGVLPQDKEFGVSSEAEVKRGVTDDDVYLYPGGMSAIWHAHHLARVARQRSGTKEGKSVCFGFPYTDTLKILQKWGPGCTFYGNGDAADLDAFEAALDAQDKSEPILAVFSEFPSNPLLRCADLKRLRQLADKHGFLIVIDETIGNFINVDVVPYADIIVSSLTKIFSGDSNVMGGSLILNPAQKSYEALKAVQKEQYEDAYYAEDAVYMERNSRDYRSRIKRVNDNAYDVTGYLYSRSLADTTSPADGKVIKRIYYPRYETTELYEACQNTPALGKGGFGGLFSVTFTSLAASRAFYDTLKCAKGPSLGTSFTLASPYTLLAHYGELDWAAEFGVESGLVRISVGQEEVPTLKEWFHESVAAAEAAGRAEAAAKGHA
ncbi:Cystathionine gamma-synthase [Vanrija albida]|uniref:Cystathionine gamma-synthase n=1 Tax=Vanrija albida TaxID=181172 RepID=A0ABR3Q6T7_9TREE